MTIATYIHSFGPNTGVIAVTAAGNANAATDQATSMVEASVTKSPDPARSLECALATE